MTAPYRKKLIEVALPLQAINEASAKEKSIRHGHPSTLHLWWARRPLAACRAVLFASLVDDPESDPAFRRIDGTVDVDAAATKRAQLFGLIEELVQWKNSNDPRVIGNARAEIARCVASRKIELCELAKDTVIFGEAKGQKHPKGPISGEGVTAYEIVLMKSRIEIVNAFLAEYAPPVHDPFAGGGSIPLEAQRLGLRAYASDLNPVPVLINKALIEIPPRFAGLPPVNPEWRKQPERKKAATVWRGAQGLAEDVRYYGKWMRDEAEKRIGHLYPKVKIPEEMAKGRPDLRPYVGQELTVIAWLWARTIASPNPAANGAHVPLVKSFWLSNKQSKKAWIEPVIDRQSMTYRFDVRQGDGEPIAGTMGRQADTCLLTGSPIPRSHIRSEAAAGRMGTRLLAVVAEGKRERLFLPPNAESEAAAARAKAAPDIADTEIVGDTRYLTPVTYGMTTHRSLFTERQLVTLDTLCELVRDVHRQLRSDPSIEAAYCDAVATYLAFGVSKLSDTCNALVSWKPSMAQVIHLFTRQAIPILWDFAEPNVFSESAGDFGVTLGNIIRVFDNLADGIQGVVEQRDAQQIQASGTARVFSTDPPYYDNVPYADLSDFFYIWLRRSLSSIYPELLTTVLVPKASELVADPFRQGSRDAARRFFESGMRRVLEAMRCAADSASPTTVFYAFKQTEDSEVGNDETIANAHSSTGWETFLQGLVDAGWTIGGTWPVRTELGNRVRGIGSNALASSIVLVCRSRGSDAVVATRREFLSALRREVPDSLRNLQHGSIAPVDMAQAAIGPGMAIFTRYAKVMETDGAPMTVRTALGLINQTLDEALAEQEGEFDGDTRWAIAWFEQFGMDEGAFGDAETLSKAKNTAVSSLEKAGIVRSGRSKVRLVRRDELPTDWDPATDSRLTVWETTQHLIRTLENEGEEAAGKLLHKLGGLGETARDLAYRLYSTCERKKWADEALAYNGLVTAWPELSRLALAAGQAEMTRRDSKVQQAIDLTE